MEEEEESDGVEKDMLIQEVAATLLTMQVILHHALFPI